MIYSNAKAVSSFALTAAMLAVSSAAFSGDMGGLTRDQVRAAYNEARASGSLPSNGEAQTVTVKASTSTLTRAAVRAEYYAARAAGTLPPTGEGQQVRAVPAPSALTREAVRAEYIRARMAGTLPLTGERG